MTTMQTERRSLITRQFFSLLPVQILIIAIGCLNSIVDGVIASSSIRPDAVAVLGLYAPLAELIDTTAIVFLGGTQILCGRFLGKNAVKETRSVFSLDIDVIFGVSVLLMLLCFLPGFFPAVLGGSAAQRSELSSYLRGTAGGIPFLMIGSQLSAFLQLEHQERRTYIGMVAMVVLNVVLDLLLVSERKMGFLGLGLATAAANLVFCVIQMSWFLTDRATIRFHVRDADFSYLGELLRLGFPGAVVQACVIIRGLLGNRILLRFCSPWGLPAFAAVNTLCLLYYAVYMGMSSAILLLTSIYLGEEDRESLYETMRTALTKGLCVVVVFSAMTFVLAEPFTRLFFSPADGAWDSTLLYFRAFSVSVPFSAVVYFFISYYQSIGKRKIVDLLGLISGLAAPILFMTLLSPFMHFSGFCLAHVLGCVFSVTAIPICAGIYGGRFTPELRELLLLAEDFGVPDSDRLEFVIRGPENDLSISDSISAFFRNHSLDKRRMLAAGLCLEEMISNIIVHGFVQGKKNEIIVRLIWKKEDLIISIKDNCRPFNPKEREQLFDPKDPTHHIGIRMASHFSRKMEYQFLLGMNVLTMTL